MVLPNRILQDREEVFFLVSLSRDGGSNPPPAICQEKQGVPVHTTWAGGSIPQVGSSGRYSSGKRLLLFLFTGFRFKKQFLNFSLPL